MTGPGLTIGIQYPSHYHSKGLKYFVELEIFFFTAHQEEIGQGCKVNKNMCLRCIAFNTVTVEPKRI